MNWRDARRILAVRLDNLGDVLMTTPALHALRAGGRHVTLLASRAGTALAPLLPDVDDVLTYDAPWVKHDAASDDPALDRAMIERLAAGRHDAAVIFTVCTQSALPAALMCRLAGIPLRLAHVRENPYGLLTHVVRDTETVADGMRHEVQRQLDLVASAGIAPPADTRLRLQVPATDLAANAARLAARGIDPARGYVVVHVGCTAASRTWPAERFGLAARRIRAATGLAVVFSGGPGEVEAVETARAAMAADGGTDGRSTSVAGPGALGELAALLAGARLLVGNNSGPAHIAAATGTPVVVLYAQTNPQHVPWQVRSKVLTRHVPCRHCLKSTCFQPGHPCLMEIHPDEAADAALDLLGVRIPLGVA